MGLHIQWRRALLVPPHCLFPDRFCFPLPTHLRLLCFSWSIRQPFTGLWLVMSQHRLILVVCLWHSVLAEWWHWLLGVETKSSILHFAHILSFSKIQRYFVSRIFFKKNNMLFQQEENFRQCVKVLNINDLSECFWFWGDITWNSYWPLQKCNCPWFDHLGYLIIWNNWSFSYFKMLHFPLTEACFHVYSWNSFHELQHKMFTNAVHLQNILATKEEVLQKAINFRHSAFVP